MLTDLDSIIREFYPLHDSSRLVGSPRVNESGYIDIIRFFGPDKVDPASLRIAYHPEIFQFSDPLITQYSRMIEEELIAEGRLYDGPKVMKLTGCAKQADGSTQFHVCPARYGDQAGSCFALDRGDSRFGSLRTLRRYWKEHDPSGSIGSNPLAISFGVCGYLLIEEGTERWLLQVVRASKLSSFANSLGPSVAGSVDYKTDYQSLDDIAQRALAAEVTEELALARHEFNIIPLAYAREIVRGERPQLFCLIMTDLNREVLSRRLESIPSNVREFASYKFLPLSDNGKLESEPLAGLNVEARMNYYLTEEYLAV